MKNKYIDAEKLIVEIEKRLKNIRDYINGAGMKYKGPGYYKARGKESAYDALFSIIRSLQQEQLDFPTTDEEIERFLATHQKAEVPDKYKTLDWFWKKQEQPDGLHFIPLNRLIQKIPSKNWNDTVNNYARKLRDCLIREGFRKDAELLQGYISYMNGNNVPMATMDEHEHPEVDLEKIEKASYKVFPVKKKLGVEIKYPNREDENFSKRKIWKDGVIWAIYELGLNTRKEEKQCQNK